MNTKKKSMYKHTTLKTKTYRHAYLHTCTPRHTHTHTYTPRHAHTGAQTPTNTHTYTTHIYREEGEREEKETPRRLSVVPPDTKALG